MGREPVGVGRGIQAGDAMSGQGTESLIDLADELREVAPNVRSWFDHIKAARLMEKAADVIERMAPIGPPCPGEIRY